MAEPWERQPGETHKRFAAFERYRLLSPHERSVRRVQRELGIASPRHLYKWSKKHDWPERAQQWDDYQARQRTQIANEQLRSMADKHFSVAQAMVEIAGVQLTRQFNAMAKKVSEDPKFVPDYLDPGVIPRWISAAVNVQRLSKGEPIVLPVDSMEARSQHWTPLDSWRQQYVQPPGTFTPHRLQRLAISDEARFLAMVCGVQSGKRLRWNEVVRTPTGWERICDLRIGSEVIGGNGKPCKVTGWFPSEEPLQFYRFTFDDGASVESCDDHLWRVLTPEARRPRKQEGQWSVLSTKEIRESWGNDPESRNRVAIPVCQSHGKSRPVPLDPYLLGALLADGTLRDDGVGYTKTNAQTVDRVSTATSWASSELVPVGNGKDYRVRGTAVRDSLRALDLTGLRSWEKKIPRCYLDNSIEVRRQLLHGLMDGDGTCTKPTTTSVGGSTTYTTTSVQLRDDVIELVRSLGGKASCQARTTSYTHNGERKQGRESYRIRVRMTENPFWCEAKATRWFRPDGGGNRKGTPDERLLYKIEPTVVERGICIAVDDPTHTFVTKDYVVTHNTTAGAIRFWKLITDEAQRLADEGEEGLYWLIAPNSVIGRVMQQAFENLAPTGWIVNTKGAESSRQWTLKSGAKVQFRSAQADDTLVAAPVNGAWLDEFTLMGSKVWSVSVRQRLAKTRGWAIFTGTPRGRNWAYEEIWRRGLKNDDVYDEEFASYTWHSSENPAIHPDEVAAAKRQLPEAYFRREWEASWEAFHGQIYDHWDRGVHLREVAELPDPPGTRYYIGVDWGLAAPGAAVVVRHRADGQWHVVEEVHVAGKLPAWWHNRIAELWRKWRVTTICCDPEDAGAIGTLVADGLPAIRANNEVAEGIRTVAALLKQNRLFVDRSCVVVSNQIGEYHWKEDAQGNRREVPVKANDHAIDALRYVIHTVLTLPEPGQRRSWGSRSTAE